MEIIGRDEEVLTINEALASDVPELLVIYGRRRIGKTFLIRETMSAAIRFEIAGLHEEDTAAQLKLFNRRLNKYSNLHFLQKTSWIDAFGDMEDWLDSIKPVSKKKIVLFFDEFPWLETPKSGFLAAFENFWNSWCTKRKDIIVVVCGSAASFIIKNVIHNKGGLYNRASRVLRLLPFSLHETKLYLTSKRIKWNLMDITQIYMAIGGVPHYLNQIKRGLSIRQSVDQILFDKKGLLYNEFEDLFQSLFKDSTIHRKLIEILSAAKRGLTRYQILSKLPIHSGGTLTEKMDELIHSGFIDKYVPFQKKTKDSLYRLSDEYCLFYYQFIKPMEKRQKGDWLSISLSPKWTSWSGFAFEGICIKHVEALKQAMNIQVIRSVQSSWIGSNENGKAQIDLLIDRDDRIINICEMKFTSDPFVITKKYAAELRQKLSIFKAVSNTKKNIHLSFVTTHGLKSNEYSLELVENLVALEDLFDAKISL